MFGDIDKGKGRESTIYQLVPGRAVYDGLLNLAAATGDEMSGPWTVGYPHVYSWPLGGCVYSVLEGLQPFTAT